MKNIISPNSGLNEIREKEKIAAQLKEANHQQLLQLHSTKKEKLYNLQIKVNG